MKYTPESIAACNAAFIDSIKRTCLSDEDFEREYNCECAKLTALVTSDGYESCILERERTEWDDFDPHADWGNNGLYVGIDCGRSIDLTVCWVLQRGYDRDGLDCYRTVCVKGIRGMTFPQQLQVISPVLACREINKGYIDQGTQGRALADEVLDITGNTVEPFGFTAPRKAEMAERVRAFVQMRRLSVPNDGRIKQSVLSVRRVISKNRTLSYDGGTTFDHGDYFWALALALHAASTTGSVYVAADNRIESSEPKALLPA